MNCFNRYLKCVEQLGKKLPELDSRTFAYLGALGAKRISQNSADYKNKLHWDLQNEYLKPLVDFIGNHIKK